MKHLQAFSRWWNSPPTKTEWVVLIMPLIVAVDFAIIWLSGVIR